MRVRSDMPLARNLCVKCDMRWQLFPLSKTGTRLCPKCLTPLERDYPVKKAADL